MIRRIKSLRYNMGAWQWTAAEFLGCKLGHPEARISRMPRNMVRAWRRLSL